MTSPAPSESRLEGNEHQSTNPPSTRTASISIGKDIADLEAKQKHLQLSLAQVNRRLNEVRSTMRKLPDEMLSLIFEHACPSPDFDQRLERLNESTNVIPSNKIQATDNNRSQLSLAAVSHRWRVLVFSRPRLWTSVGLKLRITEGSIERRIERSAVNLLRLCLRHSGALPLSIALSFPYHTIRSRSLPWQGLVDPDIDDLLVNAQARIQELHLEYPPQQWFSYIINLPKLSSFSVDHQPERIRRLLHSPPHPDDVSVISLANSHSCTRICLRALDLPISLPNRSLITFLHFCAFPIDIAINFLLECPTLVEYHCLSPHRELTRVQIPARLRSTFTHSALRVFDYDHYSMRLSNMLLQNIRLPSVEIIRWTAGFLDQDTMGFFARLARGRVETLVINKGTQFIEAIADIILLINSPESRLQNLVLSRCDACFIGEIFKKLTPEPGTHYEPPLPMLKSLTIDDVKHSDEDGDFDPYDDEIRDRRLPESYTELLVEMLESRAARGNEGGLRFEVKKTRMKWSRLLDTRIQDLRESGYEVRIFEEG